MKSKIGTVVIGRNEGDRLRRCFDSVQQHSAATIYVDSASTDDSVGKARDRGVEVVELDMSIPFTAARARNAGWQRLLELHPEIEYVHFIDGDCEMVDDWWPVMVKQFESEPQIGVLTGRLRERDPDMNVYKMLLDLEWNHPVGDVHNSGGIVTMRAQALRDTGGFDPTFIAGEEPEICFRMKQQSWRVVRNRAEMASHEAEIDRFGQWWRREMRNGHAFAEGAAVRPDAFRIRQSLSIYFWGVALPVIAVVLAWPTSGLSVLATAAMYGFLVYRLWRGTRRRTESKRDAVVAAMFWALAKSANAAGQFSYWIGQLTGRRENRFDYRRPATSQSDESQAEIVPGTANHNNGGRKMAASNQTVRIGVIGCGHVTERHHLPTLAQLDGAEVVALSDLDRGRLDLLGDMFAIGSRYEDYHVLIEDSSVDAVAVLVPARFHVEVVTAALEAGKHVFVEKPLANSLEGTSQLVDLAAQVQAKSTIGFVLRAHRLVREAKQIIDAGTLGKVDIIRTVWTGGPAHRLTMPSWYNRREAGGGVLVESAVHHFDLWRYLLAEEIVEVSAQSLSEPTDDSSGAIIARMTGGALACSVFSQETADSHEIEVYGRNGRLKVSPYRTDGLEVQSLSESTGGMRQRMARVIGQIEGLPGAWSLSRRGGIFNEAYTNEWRFLLDSIRSGDEPLVSLEDGRRALAVALAATESTDSGRSVAIDPTYGRQPIAVEGQPVEMATR